MIPRCFVWWKYRKNRNQLTQFGQCWCHQLLNRRYSPMTRVLIRRRGMYQLPTQLGAPRPMKCPSTHVISSESTYTMDRISNLCFYYLVLNTSMSMATMSYVCRMMVWICSWTFPPFYYTNHYWGSRNRCVLGRQCFSFGNVATWSVSSHSMRKLYRCSNASYEL